jgi:hypothetical protein
MGRACLGLDQADGDEDIENTEATDDAAKGRVQQKQAKSHRQMAEEIVLFPEIGPREIEEKGAHLQTKNDQDYAKRFVHERESAP